MWCVYVCICACIYIPSVHVSVCMKACAVILDSLLGLPFLSCIVASLDESFSPPLISQVNLQSFNHYLFIIMPSVRSHH